MKKSRKDLVVLSQDEIERLQKEYNEELDGDPKYSLQVDPENKYEMSELQKKFIKYYVDFKSVPTVADICGIDMDTAKTLFSAYSTQQEIRRINLALYQRQFQAKMADLDSLGGYLTCLLTDSVPLGDRLDIGDKLKVVQLIIDLNKLKSQSYQDPSTIMSKNVEVQIKNLSIQTIQQLLTSSNQTDPKSIDAINNESLSMEEKAYLETLPTDQLLELIEQTNKEKEKV